MGRGQRSLQSRQARRRLRRSRRGVRGPRRVILLDVGHRQHEPRWYCLGRIGDAILTVRFAKRGSRVRIIGAGYWRKGKRLYETQNQLQ